MTINKTIRNCILCQRSDCDVPVVLWSYRENQFFVCSMCLPTLIHELEEVVIRLATAGAGENDE